MKSLKVGSTDRSLETRLGATFRVRRIGRWVAIALASTLSILAAMLTMALPVSAQSVSLHGNVAPEASRLSPMGHADSAKVLNLAIQFVPRNQAEVNALIAAQQDPNSPQYHKWLTPSEYTRRFGPTEQDFDALADWLKSSGFQITGGSRQEGVIKFSGTVATVENAFKTKMMTFRDESHFANTTEPQVPAAFAGIVGDITGLQNLGRLEPGFKASRIHGLPIAKPPKTPQPDGKLKSGLSPDYNLGMIGGMGDTFAPADFYTFYDENTLLNSGDTGAPVGDCIAIFSDGNIFTDIVNTFTSDPNTLGFSIAPVSLTIDIGMEGDPGVLAGFDTEAYLDIEWSHSVAPGDPIILYVANGKPTSGFSFEQNLQDAIGDAVNQNKCGAINISYHACGAQASFYTGTMGTIFTKAQTFGQSVFVSTSDHGADLCDLGTPNINELSANPLITAVGGTSFAPNFDMNGNDVGFVAESVWNDNTMASAGQSTTTGGGQSQVFTTKPAFQTGEGVPNDGFRDVPDVAMIAGSPGVLTIVDTNPPSDSAQASIAGGTSLAAPIWAGISRLIQKKTGARLGSLNPRIYQLANAGLAANGFRDVLTGNNTYINAQNVTVTGFSANPGYDLVTGWGTVDITTFVNAFAASPTPTPTPTATATATATATPTATATSATSTATPTATSTAATPTATATATATGATSTPTPTATATATSTATATATNTATATVTPTATSTATPVPDVLKVTPPFKNFSTIKDGKVKKQTFTISNTAKTGPPITFGSPPATITNTPEFTGTTTCTVQLFPKQKCKIVVVFAPASPGPASSVITIFDDASNAPQTIQLQGAGK
jgi:subtilase family serine protease